MTTQVGPLERGHDAAALVASTARREVPSDWRVFDCFALKGERIKCILVRPDNLVGHYEITYDAINGGLTAEAVRGWVEELARDPS